MTVCTKMTHITTFEVLLDAALAEIGITLREISLSVGDDPSRLDKIIYLRRPASFETRLATLKLISESKLLKGKLDFPTMAAWLVSDYVPKDILRKAVNEKLEADQDLLEAVKEYREKTKKTRRRLKPEFPQKMLWPHPEQ